MLSRALQEAGKTLTSAAPARHAALAIHSNKHVHAYTLTQQELIMSDHDTSGHKVLVRNLKLQAACFEIPPEKREFTINSLWLLTLYSYGGVIILTQEDKKIILWKWHKHFYTKWGALFGVWWRQRIIRASMKVDTWYSR